VAAVKLLPTTRAVTVPGPVPSPPVPATVPLPIEAIAAVKSNEIVSTVAAPKREIAAIAAAAASMS